MPFNRLVCIIDIDRSAALDDDVRWLGRDSERSEDKDW